MRCSALSYYQNTYPSRIDFGKIQYGGTFTNEEIEDTKTVLRLLVLLASLLQSPWNLIYIQNQLLQHEMLLHSAAVATVTVELTVVTRNIIMKKHNTNKKMLLIMKVMMIGEFNRVQR